MILGISGSPRANGVTASAVKEVLATYEGATKYISLAGKRINGCISCLGCVNDNTCVVKDDFQEIAKALVEADGIVFGAPNYYGMPNALSHALWERCFCFRHQGKFLLKDKLGMIITTGYQLEDGDNPVSDSIERFMNSNEMSIVSKFSVGAYSQCYDCPQALDCQVGNVVKNNGMVEKITLDMCPPRFEAQPQAVDKCQKAGKILTGLLS